MMDSMLIEGVQLWVYRGELQAFFAAPLRTLATCCFRPIPVLYARASDDGFVEKIRPSSKCPCANSLTLLAAHSPVRYVGERAPKSGDPPCQGDRLPRRNYPCLMYNIVCPGFNQLCPSGKPA